MKDYLIHKNIVMHLINTSHSIITLALTFILTTTTTVDHLKIFLINYFFFPLLPLLILLLILLILLSFFILDYLNLDFFINLLIVIL
jgi:hypothetical protein